MQRLFRYVRSAPCRVSMVRRPGSLQFGQCMVPHCFERTAQSHVGLAAEFSVHDVKLVELHMSPREGNLYATSEPGRWG